jgi:hypothetical protein
MVCLWQQAGGWQTHTAWTCALWSQESEQKLTSQCLQKPFSFVINILAIKTNIMCRRCWKSIWVWQKQETSVVDVFWVISSEASHLIDRSQVISELIHAYVNGPISVKVLRCAQYCVCFKDSYIKFHRFSSSSWIMKFPSVYTSSWMKCQLLVTEFRCYTVMVARSSMWGILSCPRWLWYYSVAVGAICAWTKRSCRTWKPYGCRAQMLSAVSEWAKKPMWAQAYETVYVLSHTGKRTVTGKFPV